MDGMYFTCAGAPERVFPRLLDDEVLELRLRVEAPGYAPAEVDFTLTAADVNPVPETVTLADLVVEVDSYPNLPASVDVPLRPEAVALGGWVIDDDDPDTPVAGASARVTAPEPRGPVTTDARGYFRIDDLPVALAVTVEITLDTRTLTREVALQPTVPINQRTFSLPA
jgi:hypothetical protein